jgi:hypothetical protein
MFSTIGERWSTRERVGAAIADASARTGVDFSYLVQQAKIESGMNPTARASTSSATGLFQFIEQTWLGTVKKHGASHGMAWAADSIGQSANGRYFVADPSLRQAILDLRKQPEAASAMAAEFAADNRAYLEEQLGRRVEAVDLYLAHFLGAGGAAKFLAAHDADPETAAAAVAPAAARANRRVFYDRSGAPRTLAEVRERFAIKFGDAPQLPTPTARELAPVRLASLETGAAARPVTGPTPHYARLAYLMLASLGA